jgi:hypothetical protein
MARTKEEIAGAVTQNTAVLRPLDDEYFLIENMS